MCLTGGISNWGSVGSPGAISPERGLVAATMPDQPTRLAFWPPDNTFSTWVDGPQGYYRVGWIDARLVLVSNSPDPTWQARVLTLSSGQPPAVLVTASGFHAARVPTDVS